MWTRKIQLFIQGNTIMASSFASLKKSRTSSLDKLLNETKKLTEGNGQQSNGPDERIWKPTVDKAGNGYAVIRFLPEPKGEDLPWVRVFDHGFQGPGGWYIENSLTTLNQKDPVSEYNSELWNNGTDAGKEQARKQKRRLKYFANILVVKDPANPQNEGKVFLYQFGKKIWDKINDQMNPEFEDESPVNPFDFWEGADFKLKIRNVEGYRNYDKSEFDSPSELFDGDDDMLEKTYEGLYSLQELVSPDKFKSYDELKAKLDKVLGLSAPKARPAYIDEEEVSTPAPVAKEAPAPKQKVAATADEDDDDLSFFESLANDD
jgi:hypothetical protein